MAIVPNSTVTLYHNVDIDNDETLAFQNAENREEYFSNRVLEEHVNCKAVPKTGEVRLDVDYDTISQCNYMSFINPRFGNKIYYCKVIDFDFVSNKSCRLSWQIDWWMTDMFNIFMDPCHIDREHLSVTDYNKSVINPYDPSIIEMRTLESLPIGKDIEKPYYSIGVNDNTKDGIYSMLSIANAYQIDDRMGYLVLFSDIAFNNLGSGSTLNFGQNILPAVVYVNPSSPSQRQKKANLSFWQLSSSTVGTLNDALPSDLQLSKFDHCTGWDNSGQSILPGLVPATNSRIVGPINYVYIDSGDFNASETLSDLLSFFTDTDTLSCILGIYPISTAMILGCGQPTGGSSPTSFKLLAQELPTAQGNSVVNKKLDLFPYSYYRLIAPNGDTKELKIEDFKIAQDGNQQGTTVSCKVGVTLDIVERPMLIIAPLDYKIDNASPYTEGDVNLNVGEGILFSQFPTLPYAIDAFQMQLAAVSNNIIGNNTVDYSYQIMQQGLDSYKEKLGLLGDIAGALGSVPISGGGFSVLGALGNVAKAGVNVAMNGAQYDINQAKRENEWAMSEDAYKTLEGNTGEENAVYRNMKFTKPAYGASEYHPINGDGTLNYNKFNFQDIIFMRVGLNPVILAEYDKYFSMYGYASGRTKIPYIYNYVNNVSGGDSSNPIWMQMEPGKYVTYVKTSDCKVIKSNLVSSAYIRGMFNNGIRFIRGEDLI